MGGNKLSWGVVDGGWMGGRRCVDGRMGCWGMYAKVGAQPYLPFGANIGDLFWMYYYKG